MRSEIKKTFGGDRLMQQSRKRVEVDILNVSQVLRDLIEWSIDAFETIESEYAGLENWKLPAPIKRAQILLTEFKESD